jgi:amino acid transporter
MYVVFRDHLGFSAWQNPGPLAGHSPTSILSVMVSACFAFGGTELVGITAGEAYNPRVSVPKAINGTFWRICIFYVLSVFVIGLLIPADLLASLADASGLLKSPFVIGFKRAGIPASADIMNFVALVAGKILHFTLSF